MMPILDRSVFDRPGTIDEQAAMEAMLFLGDPVAAVVIAYGRHKAAGAFQRGVRMPDTTCDADCVLGKIVAAEREVERVAGRVDDAAFCNGQTITLRVDERGQHRKAKIRVAGRD